MKALVRSGEDGQRFVAQKSAPRRRVIWPNRSRASWLKQMITRGGRLSPEGPRRRRACCCRAQTPQALSRELDLFDRIVGGASCERITANAVADPRCRPTGSPTGPVQVPLLPDRSVDAIAVPQFSQDAGAL
jgi:hypothetical protein